MEEDSAKEKSRKSKKPELQLYRPGALRQRRLCDSSDLKTGPDQQISPKPVADTLLNDKREIEFKSTLKGRSNDKKSQPRVTRRTAEAKVAKSSGESSQPKGGRPQVTQEKASEEQRQSGDEPVHVKNKDVDQSKEERNYCEKREQQKRMKEGRVTSSTEKSSSSLSTHSHPNTSERLAASFDRAGDNAQRPRNDRRNQRRDGRRQNKVLEDGSETCRRDGVGSEANHCEQTGMFYEARTTPIHPGKMKMARSTDDRNCKDRTAPTSSARRRNKDAPKTEEKKEKKHDPSAGKSYNLAEGVINIEENEEVCEVLIPTQTFHRRETGERYGVGRQHQEDKNSKNPPGYQTQRTKGPQKGISPDQSKCSSKSPNFSNESSTGMDNSPAVANNNKKNDGSVSLGELAAKVDELAIEKGSVRENRKKKAIQVFESGNSEKGYLDSDSLNNTWAEESYLLTLADKVEHSRELSATVESRVPSVGVSSEVEEKSSRTKSYSSSRENRRKKGGQRKDDLQIEVTVSENSHERSARFRQKSESDPENQGNKSTEGRSQHRGEKPVTSTPKQTNVGTKSGMRGSVTRTVQLCDVSADSEEERGVFMSFGANDNWSSEMDRDLAWGKQEEERVSNPTWDDEKSWRNRRGGRGYPEIEESHKRRDSPGRRGGLIQLSSSVSAAESSPMESVSSTQHSTSPAAPVMQKHLYNPNNPSKPVPVVPSARDMPQVREVQREGGRGVGGDSNPSTASLVQSNQMSDYAVEGHSPKVDPSILYSIQKGEMDINYYVSSNQLPVEFRRIMDIRIHLQGCYKQLLVSDIRMCQEKNVEGSLWKTLYYVIIEKLREYMSRDPSLKDRSLSTLLMLVEEGQRYLHSLLDTLQQEYGFTLEDHLEEEGGAGEVRGRARLALMSAQKLLLSLGDLARYREQYNPNPNFNIAKKWYQMALQVHPRNGRPFNQLAIIALNQKRPLDVMYYYIRSLTASNPFMSARDSLVTMFDDIRKKYISQQHSEPSPENLKTTMGRSISHEGLRQEIWIRPDSGATNKRTLSQSNDEEDTENEELTKMPPEQLMKSFLTSYLHCHGMLFSRVGLDGFRECCLKMLQEFNVLLRLTPPRLSTNHLLQIMAINMYAVSNTEVKDARVGSGYRSAAQELALLLAQEMFGRLVGLVVSLLPHHLHHPAPAAHLAPPTPASDPHRLFSPTLAHFMPPLKAWCDWLLYHSSVWNPPTSNHDYCTRQDEDTWASVAELATILRGFGAPDVVLADSDGGGELVPVRLTEDAFLRGYEPLLPAHASVTYTSPAHHAGRVCDWTRVARLQTCLCQFLCGLEPPVLVLQKTDQGDVLASVVDTSPPDTPTHHPRLSLSTSDVEVEESASESEGSEVEDELEEGEEDTPLASTVRLLTRRKRVLERKHRQQRRLQSLLEGSVTLEMEVRPRYLVPDTNCFIEHLDVVQRLVGLGPYTVMVPLVVLNELEGLSRDAAVSKYGSVGHAVRVREGAATALHYLRETKPQALRYVTSQGNVLSSTKTLFSELDLPDATNDDKILSCCVHFCSDITQRRPIRAGVRRLYREVVLLTEDRNLRVKAHAMDVPVRDLLDFGRWAGVKT